jgi:hypothetical protein
MFIKNPAPMSMKKLFTFLISACTLVLFSSGRPAEKGVTVVIHGPDHTQGLDHCPDITCIMQDAKGKNTFAHETGFCKKCKASLAKKGWVFNDRER